MRACYSVPLSGDQQAQYPHSAPAATFRQAHRRQPGGRLWPSRQSRCCSPMPRGRSGLRVSWGNDALGRAGAGMVRWLTRPEGLPPCRAMTGSSERYCPGGREVTSAGGRHAEGSRARGRPCAPWDTRCAGGFPIPRLAQRSATHAARAITRRPPHALAVVEGRAGRSGRPGAGMARLCAGRRETLASGKGRAVAPPVSGP